MTIMLAASIIPAFVAELARLFFENQGRVRCEARYVSICVLIGDANFD